MRITVVLPLLHPGVQVVLRRPPFGMVSLPLLRVTGNFSADLCL